jgi:hypothetical protein
MVKADLESLPIFVRFWQALTPGVATEKVVRESGIWDCFDGRGRQTVTGLQVQYFVFCDYVSS